MKRNFTGERGRKRLLAFLLTFCMVVCGFEMYVPVAATTGSGEDITAADYDATNKDYTAEGGSFGTVTIPDGYLFNIDGNGGAVTITTLKIEGGGTLNCFNTLNVTNTTDPSNAFQPSDGAKMFLGNKDTVPIVNGSKLKVYSPDGNHELQDDTSWSWSTFIYAAGAGEGKWLQKVPNEIDIAIDGIRGETSFNLQYSYDNASWTGINGLGGIVTGYNKQDDNVFAKLNLDDENPAPSKIYIRLTVTDKIIKYAALGEDHSETGNISNRIAPDRKELVYDFDLTDGSLPRDFHFALTYENEGDPKAKDLIEGYIYAYSNLDGDSDVDKDDMEIGLATELCAKYFWDEGGTLARGNFEIRKPADIRPRIEVTPNGTYEAIRQDGTTATLDQFTYTITLGKSPEGNTVIAEGKVYALQDNDDMLIDTGSKFYIRNISNPADAVDFDGTANEDKALCVCDEYDNSKLRINGNGGGSTQNINPDNSDVYCVFLGRQQFSDTFNKYYAAPPTNYPAVDNYEGGGHVNKLRILKPSKTYIVVNSEGETNAVPGINKDQNDNVCQTGTAYEKKYTEVYVGDTTLHICPNGNVGVTTPTVIDNVTLKDKNVSDGVKITKVAADDYKVEFLSNFYDSVTLVITYSGGTTAELTIKRIGLVIKVHFLGDDDTGNSTLFHGSDSTSYKLPIDMAEHKNIVVYATYYHPTKYTTAGGDNDVSLFLTYADGSSKVMKKYYYTPAGSGTVAMTDFIITRVSSETQAPDGAWIAGDLDMQLPSFDAIIVNDGYNSTTKYSGTQMGSDRGVHWDGKVQWIYQ